MHVRSHGEWYRYSLVGYLSRSGYGNGRIREFDIGADGLPISGRSRAMREYLLVVYGSITAFAHLQVQDLIETIDLLVVKYQIERAVLVGWSFGGAVVITAGAQHRLVKAIGKDSVLCLTVAAESCPFHL